jgi:hypothetical protein
MNVFAFLILLNFTAPPCGCRDILTFEQSHYVFRGVVTSIERIEEPYIRYDINFRVEKWKKGKRKTKSMKVSAPCLVDGCCGIPFELNKRFEVYTFKDEGLDYTNSCTQTHAINSK